MCGPIRNPADQQFRRKCQVAAGISLLVYVVCSQASQRISDQHLSVILAGIAGAGLFSEFMSVGLLLARLRDEFQRVLLMKSFLWATVATMAFTMIWGFTELHGRAQVPHLDVIWVPIILICATAVAKVVLFRKHRVVYE